MLGFPFRPRGFAPPRRLPPRRSRGLVASRCQPWGSSRFLRRSPQTAEAAMVDRRVPLRRTSHPSKNPLDRSRAASPQPLPPRRSASCEAADLEALLHGRVRDVVHRCRRLASCPSWALFPSKVLFRVPRIDRVTPGVAVSDPPCGGWGVRRAPSAPACKQQAARRRAPDRGQGRPAYRRSGPGPGAPLHRSGAGRSMLRVAEATGNKPRIGRVIRR